MMPSLTDLDLKPALDRLARVNRAVLERYPGERPGRQAVHTVYGGAQLFKADTARKLGTLALKALDEHGPDAQTFGAALGLPGRLVAPVYERVRADISFVVYAARWGSALMRCLTAFTDSPGLTLTST